MYLQAETSSSVCHLQLSSARPGAFISHIRGEATGKHDDRGSTLLPQSVYSRPEGLVQEDSSWHQQAVQHNERNEV